MKIKHLLYLTCFIFPLSALSQEWQMKQAPLMTTFSQHIDPDNVLPEYPRPQLARKNWMNLNGIWEFQPGLGATEPLPQGELSRSILVPFAVESAISGVMEHHDRLWYRRQFSLPESWSGQRIMLHFGAVDYESEVYVNGQPVGQHQGGYNSFSFDITDYLTSSAEQELTVRVYDPTDRGGFPRGKQTLYPGGIMYTSVTGIWQTVWLEPVAETFISSLRLIPDIDQAILKLTANTNKTDNNTTIFVRVKDGETLVQTVTGNPNQEISIVIPSQKLWSPDEPFLYDLEVIMEQNGEKIDSVSSYVGMRKISLETENGLKKLYLNNEFVFQMGPLDQGYWPDGLYTAPTDEALRYDIEMTKALGFNMVRKHIKVEPQRWYYWADKLGVMVWQDMPSANSYTSNPQPIDQLAYERELTRMVQQHWNSPGIIMWVVFNEAQGQHRTPELVQKVQELDPSRLVNQASGGDFHGVGDVLDVHSYPPPSCPQSTTQALACGEYGGVGYKIPGHLWNDGFGYVMANSEEELLNYYENYIDQLTLFKTNQGLSAAVYTEITDVEIEVNGLMTYDRLVKANIDRIKAANRKVIEHDLYLTEVVPSSQKTAQPWKYTTQQPSTQWHLEDYNDSQWSTGNAGFGTAGTPGAIVRTTWNTPNIWLRREVTIGDLSGINLDNLLLTIHHDEDCEVYINGVLAATTTGWTVSYTTIPISREAKNALKSNSKNLIAIHCKQTSGGQYIDAGISLFSLDEPAPEITTNIQPYPDEGAAFLFPNPANDIIHIASLSSKPATFTVIHISGNEVKKVTGIHNQLHVSDLKPGIYILQVNDGIQVRNHRFIKR